MRSLKVFFVAGVLSLSMAACGGDDDDGGSTIDSAGGADSGGATGEAPVISSVAWTHVAPCAAATASDVDVVITVADADTANTALVVTGNVSSCGAIDALDDTITCPQAAPYSGTVTVADPEGNEDTQAFTISPCVDDSAP